MLCPAIEAIVKKIAIPTNRVKEVPHPIKNCEHQYKHYYQSQAPLIIWYKTKIPEATRIQITDICQE
jgi:hypothetical protein